MPVPTDITAGTISISGSTVTGVGTSFVASDIRQGDLFIWIEGGAGQWSPIVQTVTSNTVLTLAEPWTGPTISGARYRLRYQWDSSRVSAQSRQLIEMLDNGNVLALAGLTGPGVPVFDGPHSMTVRPETDFINGVAYDVQVDTLADRAAYDGQTVGFAVLVSDVGDGRSAIYSKASNTSGDWTDPAYVTGPVGPLPGIEATVATGAPGSTATVDEVPITGGVRLDFTLPAAEGFYNAGVYDIGTAYTPDQVVRHNGSSFIALQAVPAGTSPSSAFPPVDTAFWQVLAAKGQDGLGTVTQIVAGTNIAVDNTDPTAPVISSTSNIFSAPDIAALKSLDPSVVQSAVVYEVRKGGVFKWSAGDFTSRHATDPNEGLLVESAVEPITSGAWIRDWNGSALSAWWGTLGDGIADDSASMNAATLALGAIGGGELRLNAGVYRLRNVSVPSRVLVNQSLAEIRGIGAGATNKIWVLNGTASGVRRGIANASQGSILVTCSTPANAADFSIGSYALVQNEVFASPGSFGKNQEIVRVSASNATTGQVSFETPLIGNYSGSTPTIENIVPVVGSGVIGGTSYLTDATAAEGGHYDLNLCVGCKIEGVTVDGVGNLPGIAVSRSQSVDITRNIIRNGYRTNLGGYAYGISVQESSVGVTVHQNRVTGMREILCTDRSRFVIFSENIILGARNNGINAHSSTNENISIINNQIGTVTNGVAIAFGQGSGSNSDSVGVVSGNIISNTYSDGIQIVASSGTITSKVIVSNNIINRFGLNVANSNGITTNFVENLTLSGNQVFATGSAGSAYCIVLNNTARALVVNNICEGGAFGIGVFAGTKIRIQSNNLEQNVTQCIRIPSPDSSAVWILDNYSNVSNQSISGTGTYQHRNSWNTLP